MNAIKLNTKSYLFVSKDIFEFDVKFLSLLNEMSENCFA